MANINNIDVHVARLIAAIRSAAPFTLCKLPNGTIALKGGDKTPGGHVMLRENNDGTLSRTGIYHGKLTDAQYLSKVAPLLFNGFYIKEDGIYGDFEHGGSRMLDLTTSLDDKSLNRHISNPNEITSSMVLSELYRQYSKQVSNLADILFEYRNQMTMNGVYIRDGNIVFNDQMHTAVHDLIGDEHTEQTILESVEVTGRLKNPKDYQQLVDEFVNNQYLMSDEQKKQLTRAMNAIMYIIRSGLSVECDKTVTLHGHRLPTNIFLTA